MRVNAHVYIDAKAHQLYIVSYYSHLLEATMTHVHTNSRLTVLTVAIGVFITSLDINVVNTALPVIQLKLGVSVSEVQWIVVGYMFTLCAIQLVMGRLADLVGAKKVFLWGTVGFTSASLLCGIAANIALLVAARIIQAVAGSMMVATSNGLITSVALPQKKGQALAAISLAVALSTMIGPPLGGILVHQIGWNSIFLLNVPIGIFTAMLGLVVIPEDTPRRTESFDTAGSLLFVSALSTWLFFLEAMASGTLQPVSGICTLIAGIALVVLFIKKETQIPFPMLDLKMFRIKEFFFSNISASLFFIAEFLLIFIVPYYLQYVRHLSASESGLLMLPMSLGMILAVPAAGLLSDRVNPHMVASAGLVILSGASLVLMKFQATTPTWIVLADFLVAGIGAGLFQAPNAKAAMNSVGITRRGIAGATLGTMRNLGMLLGEAGAAVILASTIPLGTGENSYQGVLKAVETIGIAAATIASLALILTLRLLKRAPSTPQSAAPLP